MKRTICVNFVSVVELLSHVRLKEPLDCSLPGPSVHGVLQARILEWVASSSSRGTSSPRDWTGVSCLGRWILYHWATREALPWPKTFLSEKESFGSHFLWCIRCWWESSTRQWAAVNAVWYSVGWNINIQGSTRLQTDSGANCFQLEINIYEIDSTAMNYEHSCPGSLAPWANGIF